MFSSPQSSEFFARCSAFICFNLQSAIHNPQFERLAEGVGFEPTRPFGLPVFKTGAINRSTTPPGLFVCSKFATAERFSKREVL